jgi:ketosteroid isomerase-like protein
MNRLLGTVALAAFGVACASGPRAPTPNGSAEAAIGAMLDAWHAAAARADEAAYFAHFAKDAVFLGTDATERWDVAAFRAYAHPHFAKGKAWSFHARRRAVTVASSGDYAWFVEDLATERLGPARGSGVVVREGAGYKLVQYNLSITIPNERFPDVKRVLEGDGGPS